MTDMNSFHCEIEKSSDDALGNKITTVLCHGRLANENSGQIKEAVGPLIRQGGKIVIDLSDINFLDSAGLGALVGLKVSAIKQGMCILQLSNMTPRIMELLRITNLMELLSS
jgi:anti-anti-sigma factor